MLGRTRNSIEQKWYKSNFSVHLRAKSQEAAYLTRGACPSREASFFHTIVSKPNPRSTPMSPVVYRLTDDLPPFLRLPRGRAVVNGDVYPCNSRAREGAPPRIVRTSFGSDTWFELVNLLEQGEDDSTTHR